jgi:hypothetical protein
MATPIANLFSRIDAYKRGLFDMVQNPRDALSMMGGRIVESERQAETLRQQAFNNPNRPFQVTDPQAMQQLTDMYMSGPLGFAPAGMIKPEIAAKVLPKTKVVDESGKPLVVYHGTQRAPEGIEEFKTKTGYAGQQSAGLNWFTTSPTEASGYANWIEGMGNPTVYPVYLDIKKPASLSDYNNVIQKLNKKIEENRKKGKAEQFIDSTTPEIGLYDPRVVKELKKEGFDGVRWSNAELYGKSGFADDLDQVVLPFSSKQIKSALSDPSFEDVFTNTLLQDSTK